MAAWLLMLVVEGLRPRRCSVDLTGDCHVSLTGEVHARTTVVGLTNWSTRRSRLSRCGALSSTTPLRRRARRRDAAAAAAARSPRTAHRRGALRRRGGSATGCAAPDADTVRTPSTSGRRAARGPGARRYGESADVRATSRLEPRRGVAVLTPWPPVRTTRAATSSASGTTTEPRTRRSPGTDQDAASATRDSPRLPWSRDAHAGHRQVGRPDLGGLPSSWRSACCRGGSGSARSATRTCVRPAPGPTSSDPGSRRRPDGLRRTRHGHRHLRRRAPAAREARPRVLSSPAAHRRRAGRRVAGRRRVAVRPPSPTSRPARSPSSARLQLFEGDPGTPSTAARRAVRLAEAAFVRRTTRRRLGRDDQPDTAPVVAAAPVPPAVGGSGSSGPGCRTCPTPSSGCCSRASSSSSGSGMLRDDLREAAAEAPREAVEPVREVY